MKDVGNDKVAPREILIQNCIKGAREAQFVFAKDPEISKLIDRLCGNATAVSDFYLVVMPNAPMYGASLNKEIEKRARAEAAIAKDLTSLEQRLQPFLAFKQAKLDAQSLPFVREKTTPTAS